ncbi:MAG: CHASE2 domain-containing protein [Oceanococcus sp.]
MHTLIRFLLTSFILLGFLLHLNGFWTLSLIEQVERLTYDARVRSSLLAEQDPRVVIIDIDEKAMAAEGQWPWPRRKLAQLLQVLHEHYGVASVSFDSVFPEPDGHSAVRWLDELNQHPIGSQPEVAQWAEQRREQWDDDLLFGQAIAKYQPVMGYVFKGKVESALSQGELPPPIVEGERLMPADYFGASAFTANIQTLQNATPYAGFFDNPALDSDGVFRRVPLLQKFDDAIYGSLALMSLARALGDDTEIELEYDARSGQRTALNLEYLRVGTYRVPVDENAAVLVPYRGPQGSFPYVSVTDVLNKRVGKDVLQGTIAILGTSAAGLKDLRTTPVGVAYSGVEIHANIISGMLDGRVKIKVPYLVGIETTLLIFIGLVVTLIFPRLSPIFGTTMVVGMGAGLVGLAVSLWFGANFVLPLGSPLLFMAVLVLAQMTYGYFVEARAKREVSRLFGHYVPPELVSEMAHDSLAAGMRSDSREMTVLFSDVRDFTSISEKLDPEELTNLMNEFLTPLTQVIHTNRGTIDKYMGDAVMAFWGAPLPEQQHARRALQAAMGMVDCMNRLAEEFAPRGLPEMRIGVGVNTGVMSVGNMGSEFRMAYTVLGDAVNLGARLEGLTKRYGVSVICSDSTRRQVDDWVYRDLDLVKVKGKDKPVAIFEPLGLRSELDEARRKELRQYRDALMAYRNQSWDQAELQFVQLQKAEKLTIYQVYIDRIEIFKRMPPGADWDGVFTHTSK